jgi:hydroxymethylglutaryl-CoA reductase
LQNRVVRRGVAVTQGSEYTAAHVHTWVQKAYWLDNAAAGADTNTRGVMMTVSIHVVRFAAVVAGTHYGLRILFNGGETRF